MFKVSDAATLRLAEELERLKVPDEKVVRFCVDTAGLHLRLSYVRDGDTEFAHAGRTVLVVDDDLAQRLTSRTLEVRQTPSGTKLSLATADRDEIES